MWSELSLPELGQGHHIASSTWWSCPQAHTPSHLQNLRWPPSLSLWLRPQRGTAFYISQRLTSVRTWPFFPPETLLQQETWPSSSTRDPLPLEGPEPPPVACVSCTSCLPSEGTEYGWALHSHHPFFYFGSQHNSLSLNTYLIRKGQARRKEKNMISRHTPSLPHPNIQTFYERQRKIKSSLRMYKTEWSALEEGTGRASWLEGL